MLPKITPTERPPPQIWGPLRYGFGGPWPGPKITEARLVAQRAESFRGIIQNFEPRKPLLSPLIMNRRYAPGLETTAPNIKTGHRNLRLGGGNLRLAGREETENESGVGNQQRGAPPLFPAWTPPH
jgi:hypothetical protein